MSNFLEFRHLRYIVAVARTRNFTRAAKQLYLSQPSLSKQIRDVEDAIGFPIFERNPESLKITRAGQLLVAYAQDALEARAEAIQEVRAVALFRQES